MHIVTSGLLRLVGARRASKTSRSTSLNYERASVARVIHDNEGCNNALFVKQEFCSSLNCSFNSRHECIACVDKRNIHFLARMSNHDSFLILGMRSNRISALSIEQSFVTLS